MPRQLPHHRRRQHFKSKKRLRAWHRGRSQDQRWLKAMQKVGLA